MMRQLKPQLPKVLCPDLIVCFLNGARHVASYLRFSFLCLHSKVQPHFKNSIPKNSNHLLELLPLSNGLPNRFILSPPKLSSTFLSRTDRGVFQVFFTMTCFDWRLPAVFLRGCLASCFIQFFLPPAVSQLLGDSIPGVGQHKCPFVSVDCPIRPASGCQWPLWSSGACFAPTECPWFFSSSWYGWF